MTKLSDTQVIILSAAAQRDDGNVLPLPGSLRGGAAGKVVGALLSRGLIAERITDSMAKADPALNRIWRNEPDGRGVLLFITPAGLDAIGIETPADPEAPVEYRVNEGTNCAGAPAAGAPTGTEEAPVEAAPKRRGGGKKTERTGAPSDAPRKSPDGTKQALLIAMLRRPAGATIVQIVEATGWQPHTVRGAFAGALKKKLGLEVTSEKAEGGERVYKIEG
jgi:hypothetical protein